MASVRHDTADRLRQRVCLSCGYRGPELQPGYTVEVFVCPLCACDLYARPPRSYEEMEGIAKDEPRSAAAPRVRTTEPDRQRAGRPVAAAARWLRRVVRWVFPRGG